MKETHKTKGGKVSTIIFPPTEKEIVFCISLYFGIPANFNRYNIAYKPHLYAIADKRNFLAKIKRPDNAIFKEWLSSPESKMNLSRKYFNGNTSKGRTVINKYLLQMVAEIKADHTAGMLTVQPYEKPIKPSSRAHFKKLNKDLEALGMKSRLPLRKKSGREIVANYIKSTQDL